MSALINTLAVIILSGGALHAQKLDVKLHEELVLGGDESASAEYLFSWPKAISTDSHNHIYVADRNSSKVRVFDHKGRFIKSIGRKGQGAGEMQEVTCMVVDRNDDLIVVDR
ncbi:6-bladed beta-propeller, partial [bacterium]|nr:6-bladed beta-propeller [bacterium]